MKKWLKYEKEKAKLVNLPPEEYERKIRELAKRLRI